MRVQSILTLQRRVRPAGPRGTRELAYDDVRVDGRSLGDALGCAETYVCALGWGPPALRRHAVARLLLEAPPDMGTDRYALYVCPECGDFACGAVTVSIVREGDEVVWRDLGLDYAYDGTGPTVAADVGPFRFEWEAYRRVLIGSLPDDG